MIPLTFTTGFANGDDHLTVPSVTVVYGGGGPFGIAYGLGVAHALLDAGIPLRKTPSLGTSAGAWVASCLATHTSFHAVDMMPAISVPNLSPGLLHRLAKDLFGEAGSALVTATAVRVPSGRRVLLSAPSIRWPTLSPPRPPCPGCSPRRGSAGGSTPTAACAPWSTPTTRPPPNG